MRRRWPGINAMAVTYDFAHDGNGPLMLAGTNDIRKTVNRMLHIDESAGDLLNNEGCPRARKTGWYWRYLAHDALGGILQAVSKIDDARVRPKYTAKFSAYLQHVQDKDLTLGIAMTDAKGDRSKRPQPAIESGW